MRHRLRPLSAVFFTPSRTGLVCCVVSSTCHTSPVPTCVGVGSGPRNTSAHQPLHISRKLEEQYRWCLKNFVHLFSRYALRINKMIRDIIKHAKMSRSKSKELAFEKKKTELLLYEVDLTQIGNAVKQVFRREHTDIPQSPHIQNYTIARK